MLVVVIANMLASIQTIPDLAGLRGAIKFLLDAMLRKMQFYYHRKSFLPIFPVGTQYVLVTENVTV
jgi:hypothetical protein